MHRRLIRIGLDALANDFGYALAGGYAVQAHQIVSRVSDDVDLFAPIDRATAEMPAATERVIDAYEAAGFTVELAHQNAEHTYTRLNVTDPVSGVQNKVELVAEFLNHPPVPSELGPVLHPDDVAAGKTSALDGRAEVRDAIDVDGLLKAGYTRERLMELARQNDDGFDPQMFADSLARIQRYTDKQFAAYGLTAAEAAVLRERFADWRRQLITPQDEKPEGKRTTAAARTPPRRDQSAQQNPNTTTKPPPPAPGSPGRTPPHGPRRG
ncbi:nucleotidyl transferase AbiEii/AbiGii toxin family protein [Streptomyces shenzhenensis]|uniref:nucleotidyl transferase AbiEii/AbiGii toxin family protein n=1 Tax=Streptomyces shenzhenensis TaxID=943815 RepID=UPI001F1CA3D1|nr:nucleotidyl transferase AbiEii/AbiGii toxin family protein [Streptomyces shenzhenensis]